MDQFAIDGRLVLYFRCVVGGLLLLAALLKLRDMEAFRTAVADYAILPQRLVRPVSASIAPLEASVGLLLLLGVAARAAALGAVALLSLFAAAILTNLLRGRSDIGCGCMGAGSDPHLTWFLVLRNLLLVALSLGIAVGGSGYFGAQMAIFAPNSLAASPTDALLVVLAALVTIILMLSADSLSTPVGGRSRARRTGMQ